MTIEKQIDPKYRVQVEVSREPGCGEFGEVEIDIVNALGVPVPEDEPMILFRARDLYALPMLVEYCKLCASNGCTEFHLKGIENRLDAFRKFREEHKDRMKQPGITRGM
jgi:hypothetical protein